MKPIEELARRLSQGLTGLSADFTASVRSEEERLSTEAEALSQSLALKTDERELSARCEALKEELEQHEKTLNTKRTELNKQHGDLEEEIAVALGKLDERINAARVEDSNRRLLELLESAFLAFQADPMNPDPKPKGEVSDAEKRSYLLRAAGKLSERRQRAREMALRASATLASMAIHVQRVSTLEQERDEINRGLSAAKRRLGQYAGNAEIELLKDVDSADPKLLMRLKKEVLERLYQDARLEQEWNLHADDPLAELRLSLNEG